MNAGPGESVREEIYFVQPDIIRFLFVVSIHLECDINFFLVPIRLGGVIDIDRIFLIRNTHADIVHLIADPFELPH